MSIVINQIAPLVAAQGVSGDIVFQPGSVIAARVVKSLSDDQVRILIGTLPIDVQSEVALQPGQLLQLAVSQTTDGIRLAVVAQQGTPADDTSLSQAALTDTVTLAPDAPVVTSTTAAARIVLTPAEASAVSSAAQFAVTQQAGLSSLFANLGAAASLQNLPLPLQQAVTQLLARQPVLDANLTGGDVQNAFQNSGLFLEASLASGTVSSSPATPDLKAALIVFRELLSGSLPAAAATPAGTVPSPASSPANAALLKTNVAPGLIQPGASTTPQSVPDPDAVASIVGPASPANAGLRAAAATAALSLLQDAQELSAAGVDSQALAGESVLPQSSPAAKSQIAPRGDIPLARNIIPPPPVRGALPSAQPVALATLPPDAPLASTVKHLLVDTDAAIARQTLMQVASLPDRVDGSTARLDPTVPRWNFEIPFATPQGTAVAQFEISRDGGSDRQIEAVGRVWRARFSLDIEPAGPVHALVSLSGDRTSVRMWAERPVTALQLRADAAQLGQALLRADLKPGDIVIQQGTPPQPAAPASAGHFLDCAL